MLRRRFTAPMMVASPGELSASNCVNERVLLASASSTTDAVTFWRCRRLYAFRRSIVRQPVHITPSAAGLRPMAMLAKSRWQSVVVNCRSVFIVSDGDCTADIMMRYGLKADKEAQSKRKSECLGLYVDKDAGRRPMSIPASHQ